MSTSTNSLPSPKGRNSKLITSLAAKTDGRPQHKHYTKKINLSGQICHVHLNITRNGNFMVKIQMPDGSIRPFGSASFPNESYALAAASRAAQRIFDSNRKGG